MICFKGEKNGWHFSNECTKIIKKQLDDKEFIRCFAYSFIVFWPTQRACQNTVQLKKNTQQYYTLKCLITCTCLYSKRHSREDTLIMHTFLPGGCGSFLANTSLSPGKPSQPPVSSNEVSLSSGLPPSNGSHKAHLTVTVWFWDRIRLPDREG